MKLSVIVPVYNVEKYIRTCIKSIFNQGLPDDDFELILVNDGTQDNSFNVITDIISQHNNVLIIEQENQGLSAARNRGLENASGQYILFLDSDDLLIDNTLVQLLDYTNDAFVDMLIADFIKMDDKEIDLFDNNCKSDCHVERKVASQAFTEFFNPKECFVWRTIYRKAFLDNNNIRFITGIFFEDVPFTTECYLKARYCIKTTLPFYIYRQRTNSIVSSINIKKILDFNIVLAELWHMYKNYTLSLQVHKQLMNTIFITFSVSMWYVSHDPILLAQREKIVSDLSDKIPDLYFTNGFKQMTISLFFRLAPCSYIKLRSYL